LIVCDGAPDVTGACQTRKHRIYFYTAQQSTLPFRPEACPRLLESAHHLAQDAPTPHEWGGARRGGGSLLGENTTPPASLFLRRSRVRDPLPLDHLPPPASALPWPSLAVLEAVNVNAGGLRP
jgi:hypothetical protein